MSVLPYNSFFVALIPLCVGTCYEFSAQNMTTAHLLNKQICGFFSEHTVGWTLPFPLTSFQYWLSTYVSVDRGEFS